MPVAKVGQFTHDIRQNSGAWFTGENMTGATLRYLGAMSFTTVNEANSKAEIKAAIDGNYHATNPTTIPDWSAVGSDASTTVLNDNVIKVGMAIDRGSSGSPADTQSYCCPFAIRNGSGYSATYVFNRPRVFGIAGADPSKLYYKKLYALHGRHLRASSPVSSVWLWNGTTPVDTSKLHQCKMVEPGGFGSGGGTPRDKIRLAIYFEIPSTVPAGNYYLFVFTNENRYGMSNPTAIPVTVMGTSDPWLTNPVLRNEFLDTPSGTDITVRLTQIMMDSIYSSRPATEAAPWLIQLPPGVFYLSHTIPWAPNVGVIGSGASMTRVMPNPKLNGIGINQGNFFVKLSNFSTLNGSCYSGKVGITDRLSGIFNGNQTDIVWPSESALIRIAGANTYFKDLTFELSPDDYQKTCVHIFAAGPNTNRATFDNVDFLNQIADSDSTYYVDGIFYRYGLWKYWKFRGCNFRCGKVIEARNGALNGFAHSGAFDYGLVDGCTFTTFHGETCAGDFGSAIGRGTLIHALSMTKTRRGFAGTSGDYTLESTMIGCSYKDMLSEIIQGEPVVHEARGSALGVSGTADATSFTIAGDSFDRTRWTVYVFSGKGKYQYRVIASSNTSTGKHTLETPWEIVPDGTSVFIISPCPTDCGYSWNRFDGCAGGLDFYGNAYGNIVAANWFRNSHEGIMCNTNFYTAGSSGLLSQSGDGRSASMWHSFRTNTLEDTAGFNLIATRSTSDCVFFQEVQIGFISIAFNLYYGDVVNQLCAGEGSFEVTSNENGSSLATINLINYVMTAYDASYSDRSKYLHNVIARTFLPRNVWFKSLAGVANFSITGHKVDDITPADMTTLISTSANKTPPDGKLSLNSWLASFG